MYFLNINKPYYYYQSITFKDGETLLFFCVKLDSCTSDVQTSSCKKKPRIFNQY